jgi:hypothetical protein
MAYLLLRVTNKAAAGGAAAAAGAAAAVRVLLQLDCWQGSSKWLNTGFQMQHFE